MRDCAAIGSPTFCHHWRVPPIDRQDRTQMRCGLVELLALRVEEAEHMQGVKIPAINGEDSSI
jgi:hypothetical protein